MNRSRAESENSAAESSPWPKESANTFDEMFRGATVIYLNNAATSWPKAPGVDTAVLMAIKDPIGDSGRATSCEFDPVEDCRHLVAQLLGVDDATRIVFTLNATMALNMAIQGLGMGRDDLVIASVAEHNSVLRPLEKLHRERGVRVVLVPLAPDGLPDAGEFYRALAGGPRLVVLTHASNVTGRVFPVEYWFAQAKLAGAFTLLDASQSLGLLCVSPARMQADLVAFTGHKALHGPAGTGGLYVGPGIDLEQLLVGGTGARSDLAAHPADMPDRLEAGTRNLPGLAGLGASLRWLAENGDTHNSTACQRAALLRSGLAAIPGVRILDAVDGERVGIVSFRMAGWPVEEAGMILNESFGIVCRAGLHCAPRIHDWIGSGPAGSVRFSVSGFNTEEDIEAAASAVRKVALCAS